MQEPTSTVRQEVESRKALLREILDDSYYGLRQTSNTNKSRQEILGMFDELASTLLQRIEEMVPEGFSSKNEDLKEDVWEMGWNACRKQMLANLRNLKGEQ